jgi:hypothetical protein
VKESEGIEGSSPGTDTEGCAVDVENLSKMEASVMRAFHNRLRKLLKKVTHGSSHCINIYFLLRKDIENDMNNFPVSHDRSSTTVPDYCTSLRCETG